MDFRFDFGQKIDLTIFKKRLFYDLTAFRENKYLIYIQDYMLLVELKKNIDFFVNGSLTVLVSMNKLTRDMDGEIVSSETIDPLDFPIFDGINAVYNIFGEDQLRDYKQRYKALIFTKENSSFFIADEHSNGILVKKRISINNTQDTVFLICELIKLLHKLQDLKVFL